MRVPFSTREERAAPSGGGHGVELPYIVALFFHCPDGAPKTMTLDGLDGGAKVQMERGTFQISGGMATQEKILHFLLEQKDRYTVIS